MLVFSELELIYFWFLFLLNILILYVTYVHVKKTNFFFSPILFFSIDYILSYLLKPLVLIFPIIDVDFYFKVYNYNSNEFIKSFLFSTSYFFVFSFSYLLLFNQFKNKISYDYFIIVLKSNGFKKFSYILLFFLFVSVFYFLFNREYVSLVSLEKRSYFVLFFDYVFQLYPFLIIYSVFNNKHKILFIAIGLVILMSFLSTAKGHLFWLLIFLFLSWKQIRKPFNYWFLIPLIILSILFTNYSYIFRFTQGVDKNDTENIISAASMSTESIDKSFFSLFVVSIINRFESFDNLIYIDLQRDINNSDLYTYGSLIDLQFLIPSIIYRNPNSLRTHYMMSMEILQNQHFSSVNFDRIMEAYLYDFVGIILAVFSAFIFFSLNFLINRKSTLLKILIFLITLKLFYAAPIFSSISIIIFYGFIIFLFIKIKNILS